MVDDPCMAQWSHKFVYVCMCFEGFFFVILYMRILGPYAWLKKKLNGPAGVWNKNPVAKESFILPPKIKWFNESCLLWNQQPIRNKKNRWLVENKKGGRKGCVDLWATIKTLKITGSSIITRLLSVLTYKTDLQEYLASFKRTLFQCCYWSVRTCIYTYSTVVWYWQLLQATVLYCSSFKLDVRQALNTVFRAEVGGLGTLRARDSPLEREGKPHCSMHAGC